MKTVADILLEYGIHLSDTSPGRRYTTCPKCSAKRKPGHQKLECLGVTIDDKGARGGCNHCDWTFPEKKANGHDTAAAGKWTKQGNGYTATPMASPTSRSFATSSQTAASRTLNIARTAVSG